MEHMAAIAAVAALVFGYSLVSGHLEMSPITPPMMFVSAGIVIGAMGLGLVDQDQLDVGAIGVLAEGTLVLLLFTDAIRIDLSRLRREAAIPLRLLGVGLPLTVLTGTVIGVLIFPELGWAGALTIAAILAPTDAALGDAVISNRRVPIRIRQNINVESGLNDGLMVPIVAAAVALLVMRESGTGAGGWALLVGRQVGFGALLGALTGASGGRLLDLFAHRSWVDGIFRQLATLSIGVGAFAGAELVGGNGFVAAFVAGLAFGVTAREHCEGAYDFSEDEGQLLSLLTFLAFGATVAGPALQAVTPRIVLYAMASLTIVRMVPVATALIGSRLKLPTVAYIGWFGPRGLASILFAVFLLEGAKNAPSEIFTLVVCTVLLSVYLHGATAAPLSNRYAAWVEGMAGELTHETAPMTESPVRARAGGTLS